MICISGLLNIETTISVRKFPIDYYPIDYPFFGINSSVSGVAYNISKSLKTLGDKINLCSFISEDFEGKMIIEELKKEKINVKGIKKTLKSTPVSAILYDETGKRQIYCDLKDIQDQSLNDDDVNNMGANDIYIICNINFNRNILKLVKEKNKLIATDVHVLENIDDEYNKDFMEAADILFMSDEALPYEPDRFIKDVASKYDNKIVVIGMGDKGAMLYEKNKNKLYKFDAVYCENVVNTVGAGDALFSSFLHFYAKDENALEALVKAEIFASEKIKTNGAANGFIDEKTVEELAKVKRPHIEEL